MNGKTVREASVTPGQAVPAPWQLAGSGLILLLKAPADASDPRWYAMPDTARIARPGLGLLMFVDYRHSDAGPYRELLFIPGRFRCGKRRYWSVTRILVSTAESVSGGRANWGIPKELGDFRLSGEPGGSFALTVSQGGQPVAEIGWRGRGPALPVTTALVPAASRTLLQVLDGRQFRLAPSARGRVGGAHLEHIETNPDLFPAIEPGRILSALSIPRFRMTFPAAQVSPCRR